MSACARSLRLDRKVFVRIVTGLGISFDSKNSMACRQLVSVLNIREGLAHLKNRKEMEKLFSQEVIVAIVARNICEKLFNIL